jgi:hypothetical protein
MMSLIAISLRSDDRVCRVIFSRGRGSDPRRRSSHTAYNATTEDGGNAVGDPLVGREVLRTVYAGKAITFDNTRAPVVVKRNQVVSIKYIKGGSRSRRRGAPLARPGSMSR